MFATILIAALIFGIVAYIIGKGIYNRAAAAAAAAGAPAAPARGSATRTAANRKPDFPGRISRQDQTNARRPRQISVGASGHCAVPGQAEGGNAARFRSKNPEGALPAGSAPSGLLYCFIRRWGWQLWRKTEEEIS